MRFQINTRIIIFAILLLGVTLLATACSTIQKAEISPGVNIDSTPSPLSDLVIAEGNLVPKKFDYLNFSRGGTVSEVLVSKGESVREGQILARLGDREQLEANLAGAELELLTAQQSYDELNRLAELSRANAWLDLIEKSNAYIRASRNWDNLDVDRIDRDIENAKISVNTTQEELKDAQDELAKYSNVSTENPDRKRAQDRLDDAVKKHAESVRILDELENQRDQAKASLDLSKAALDEARRRYEASLDGPEKEKLALAKARVDYAQSVVSAAKLALNYLEIQAPYSGVIVDINISENQLASPNEWAFVIADLSQWVVETNDLNELEVARLIENQNALLVPDALPEIQLTGKIEEISAISTYFAGDVLYKVRISVNETDPRLRWGMTFEVSFLP